MPQHIQVSDSIPNGDLSGTYNAPILQNTANVQSIIAANGATVPDATTTVKGKIKLAGDLSGTADLPTVPALASKANISSLSTVATSGSYNDLLNKPATYVPTDASTSAKGIVQLAGDLSGTAAAPTVPALANKANTASPAFTGTPTAPTAAANTNTTQIATTAFTQAAITALVNASPSTLDTLKELADAIGDDPNFAVTVSNQIALKANIASPTFTGTPAAPTATAGTNTTQIATTAFVTGAVASATPADATTTSKGIIQLAGDLSGTAAVPTVPALANKKDRMSQQATQTASFTAVAGRFYPVNASSGNVTVTLPTSTVGQEIQIKKLDANALTGATSGIVVLSGNINGGTGNSIPLRYINQGKQALADGNGGWSVVLGDVDITSLYAVAQQPGTVQLSGDLGGTATAPTTPTAVHITGAESVAGVKTFSSSPSIPDPTLAQDAASKNYVDTNKGNTRSVSSVSSSQTAGSAARTDYVYNVTATATITLPTAVGNTNRYTITNTTSGTTTTIATTSSQTVNGSATMVFTGQYVSYDLISDGANWFIR